MAVKSQFWMVSFPPLLNALAPWNMPSMSVTSVIIHFFVAVGMGWLKATAPLNMFEVLVKAVVSQFWMVSFPPLLNALAPWNMAFMSFTADVSQTGDVPGVSSWLNVSAFRNISCMSVTTFVSQVFRGWLKAFAPLNIRTISVTLSVFHLLPSVGMAWLNFAAPLNMFFMVVTLAVFQSLMDASPALLKAAAASNVANIVVTRAVSQVPTFWLKALAPKNMPSMSVTWDVFHWLPVVAHTLLNAAAPLNMFFIVATLAVSHRSTSPLNFAAPSNIPSMLVTSAVFHLSPLVLIV